MFEVSKILKLKPTMDWIIKDDDQRIRLKSNDLTFPLGNNDYTAISKMIAFIDSSYDGSYGQYKIRPGVAIAGVQINYLKRVIYLHFDDEYGNEKKWLLGNPKIISFSEETIYLDNGEGCLSVPEDRNGFVPRKSKIKVEAIDLFSGQVITIEESDYSAIVLQHEIDHLDGILYYDHINVLDPYYNKKEWRKI